MSQLPADCLNDIFEYLEEDRATLRSCLLVNRLWCEVSVRILWRRIRSYNIVISCLMNKLGEILYENGFITSTPISISPTFNYLSFCKDLSVGQIYYKVVQLLEAYKTFGPEDHGSVSNDAFTHEILKLL